jgi:hypothetical protein
MDIDFIAEPIMHHLYYYYLVESTHIKL